MRLLSYRREQRLRHGYLLDDTHLVELGDGDLGTLLAREEEFTDRPGGSGTTVALSAVQPAAPVPRPGKVLGVAANYQGHIIEGGGTPVDKSRLAPRLFLMPPTAVAGPHDPITMPSVSSQVDWEAELAVVIGRTARDIPVDEVARFVAGFTIGNDVSARSLDYGYGRDTDEPAQRFFDWLAGKWLDAFAPMGPYLVTPDEVGDPQNLDIELAVNDVVRQRGTTNDMIFTVAELVSFASRLMTLEPGDVLLTGTPAGVGMATGEFLAPGDEMVVTISGLGQLVNTISAGRPAPRTVLEAS